MTLTEARSDLFLCSTGQQLCLALSTLSTGARPGTIVFVADDMPAPPGLRAALDQIAPGSALFVTTDAEQIAAFSRLPAGIPALLRRNLSLSGLRPIRPSGWQPAFLAGQRFATGYFGNSGFFLSKCLAPLCRQTVLRESGMNNYRSLRVPPLKAALRALTGLPPFRQVHGEERWINRIEVSRPQDLPAPVRHKASQLTFPQAMQAMPPAHRAATVRAFLEAPLRIPPGGGLTAVLLAQPLHEVGMTDPAARLGLYADLAADLAQRGYRVVLKPHPRDPGLRLPDFPVLPAGFPIELWPYCADRKFDLAVAIRSAALDHGSDAFATRRLQLVPARDFAPSHFSDWVGRLRPALAAALGEPT